MQPAQDLTWEASSNNQVSRCLISHHCTTSAWFRTKRTSSCEQCSAVIYTSAASQSHHLNFPWGAATARKYSVCLPSLQIGWSICIKQHDDPTFISTKRKVPCNYYSLAKSKHWAPSMAAVFCFWNWGTSHVCSRPSRASGVSLWLSIVLLNLVIKHPDSIINH